MTSESSAVYVLTIFQATLDGLRSLNQMVEGTSLPRLKMEEIEQMIERDRLTLLRIE